jgi:hypothetical protein
MECCASPRESPRAITLQPPGSIDDTAVIIQSGRNSVEMTHLSASYALSSDTDSPLTSPLLLGSPSEQEVEYVGIGTEVVKENVDSTPVGDASSICSTSTVNTGTDVPVECVYSTDFATISSLSEFGNFGPKEDVGFQMSRVVKEHDLCGEGALWAHLQSLAVSIQYQQTQMKQSMLMFERSASASRNVSNRSKKMWRKKFIMLQREFPRWWGVERKTEIKESFKHINYSVAVLKKNVQELRNIYTIDMRIASQHFMTKLTEYIGHWTIKREKTMEGFIQNAWKSTQEKEQIICDREDEIVSFKDSLKNSEEKANNLLTSHELEIDKLKESHELEIDKLKESHATIINERILELKEIHKTEVDEMKDEIDVLEKLVSTTKKERSESNDLNEEKIRKLKDELECSQRNLLKLEKEKYKSIEDAIESVEKLQQFEIDNKELLDRNLQLGKQNKELIDKASAERTTLITTHNKELKKESSARSDEINQIRAENTKETEAYKSLISKRKAENEKLKKEKSELTKKCAASTISSAEKKKLEEIIKSCQDQLSESAEENASLVNDIANLRERESGFNLERLELNNRIVDCEHHSQRRFLHMKLFSWSIELELGGLNTPLAEAWKNFKNLNHNYERHKMGMMEKRRTEKKPVDFDYMKNPQTTQNALSSFKRDFFAGYGLPDAILSDVNCPITTDLLENPVVAADGHTYEKSEISSWIVRNRVSPKTQARLSTIDTIDNILMKKFIGCMMDFSKIHTVPIDIFVCPLSKKSLTNPSIAYDGVTYDTNSIKQYMAQHSNVNFPNSRTKIVKRALFPNYSVRSILFTLSGNTVVAHKNY